MTTLHFKPLLLAVALALLGSAPIAKADDNTSHKYCPPGASMYWGIFGYWCEDSTYAGVHPLDCKSGPGQAIGTWNNGSLTPDQLCMQQNGATTQPITSTTTTSTTPTATSTVPQGTAPGSPQDFVTNVGDRVFFGFDQYNLTAEAQAELQKQVTWLKTYPQYRFVIEGHCDERGTREYNLALGERRSTAVKNYLIALGIHQNRMQTISYGKERPVVPGSNEKAWAQNRRAVIILQ
jgi:peptidoglycan-associated lipoprotein